MCQCPRIQAASWWGVGLRGGEVGDGVHGLGEPFAAAGLAGASGDLHRLRGVQEADAGGDGDNFQGALLDPAVAFPGGGVSVRNVGPGQSGDLVVQRGLVAFHGQQIVRAAAAHQILGV